VDLRLQWAGYGVVLALSGAGTLGAQDQPAWSLAREAKNGLADLWDASLAGRREYVACLGGWLEGDTVHVSRLQPLDVAQADSLTAEALESIARCGPPEWIGTVHTHIRSTDDDQPSPRFSPSDRAVMSEWIGRWARQGAFCVLHSAAAAHCEVYPPGLPLRPGRE
jgi:hypothetical protein